MNLRRTTFLVAVTFSTIVWADEEVDATGNYFDEFPVVLSASRLVQPAQEAPAAVTVIDRDMIRASGARQIAELFRLVPGFQVSYRNGHSPIVTYHGLADPYARRLQVMIDGISFYSPAYGGVDWYGLPIAIDDIEHIEIVRGPNGASFGANAFTGMVNIITREPAAGDPSDVAATSGHDGINDWSARYTAGHDNWSYRLSAGQRADNGFDNHPDSSRVKYLNLRGRYRLNSTLELSGALMLGDGVVTEFDTVERPKKFNQDDILLRATRASGSDEVWLQVHHSLRHERDEYFYTVAGEDLASIGIPGVPSFRVPVSFSNDQRRDEVEFQQSFGDSQRWRMAWGGQWRQDAVLSAPLFSRDDWLKNQLRRVFANGEWRPAKPLLLQAGATYEDSSLSGGSISPRVSATIELSDMHSVRVGVSRARRIPTPFEESSYMGYWVPADVLPLPLRTIALSKPLAQRYANTGGLRDEKILSREIAYMLKWPSLHLTGDVRWYWDQADDLIYIYRIRYPEWISNYQTWQFRNADHARLRGTEGSLRWSPWQGSDIWVGAARTTIDSSNLDADYSSTAPTHSASVLISQQFPWDTVLSLAYYRIGAMQWLGGGDPVPGYERVDVRLGKRFRWGQRTAELSWVTQNLLDSNYSDFDLAFRNRRVSWVKFQYTF